MTIEAVMRLEFENNSYLLMIKMIRIDGANYFFIRDKENEKPLLFGKTLELTYTNSFSLTVFAGKVKSTGIPEVIISVIETEILKNRQQWLVG